MDSLVQSARDAADRGDKNQAMELIKQVLHSHPDDIDALLVLATLIHEPMRKRQVLNRVLSLEATNKTAREMMLEMDRAEMSSFVSHATVAPKSEVQPQASSAQKAAAISLAKPITFRYSPTWMIVLYVFTTISCCATFWFASMDMRNSLPFLAMALVLGLTTLTVSSRVEASETSIRVSTLIGSTEMEWNEIASIQLNPLKRNMELTSKIGEVANISTQTTGYKTITEILRQKRPDLMEAFFVSKSPVMAQAEPQPSSPALKNESISVTMPNVLEPTPAAPPAPAAMETAATAMVTTPPTPTTVEKQKEKPLVLRFPLFWRIFMYAFPIFFGCLGLLVAYQSVVYGLPLIALALVLGLIAVMFSPKVEVMDSGIRAHGMLDSSEVQWNEIVQMKAGWMQRTLDLSKANGEVVKVSTQVSGYPKVVEILRQKRPDLFSLAGQPVTTGESTAGPGTVPAPVFSGSRTFTKSTFAQYGALLIMIPLGGFGFWAIAMDEAFVGIAMILTGLFFVVMSLFNVNQLKLEPSKLTTESFVGPKEYRAEQIRDIQMKTVRSRRGAATNYVNVQLVEGGAIRLVGFQEGDELVYGVLREWWETYRPKKIS